MAKAPSGSFRVGNVSYGRFSGVNPRGSANENLTERQRIDRLKSLTEETDRMLKQDKSYKLNSGRYAYEKPATSAAGRVAGAVGRAAGRLAGPVGALVSMTTPAGEGSDKPSGPLMSGPKKSGPGGGSLNAPARTEPSRSGRTSNSRGPGGPNGPNSGPSRSSNPSRGGGGPGGPSGPNSGPSRSGGPSGPSRSRGPGGPSGPNSGPSKSSSSPRGSERFAKGSLVMTKYAKKNYFSKEAVKRSRSSFKAPKGKAR